MHNLLPGLHGVPFPHVGVRTIGPLADFDSMWTFGIGFPGFAPGLQRLSLIMGTSLDPCARLSYAIVRPSLLFRGSRSLA